MSRVSVIMPVYMGAAFVARAIESVLSQTHQDLELIVVNDGSPDNSHAVIQPYLLDARVKYIEQDNAGVANARNTGIRHASGEFLALIDQDDLWTADKLAKQLHVMELHPEFALVHCDIGFIDAAGQTMPSPEWAWVQETWGHCYADLLEGNRIATLTVLLRRGCLDGIEMFRQEMAPADDWDLWLRLAAKYPFGYVPEKLAFYRLHESNESRDLLKMQTAETNVIRRVVQDGHLATSRTRQIARRKLVLLYKATAELADRLGQRRIARDYYFKALVMCPWCLSCFTRLGFTFLTSEQRQRVNWYQRKLFSSRKPTN